jgi:deazaflavin-dependent oxidoreductase (nitroreductase family)
MPLGRRVARFNRTITNRVLGKAAPWLPGFGVVVHSGRRSGRTYRTPVNVFIRGEWAVFALTYGTETDWVRNVLSAGECGLVTRGRRLELTLPRLVHDENRSGVPGFVRTLLGFMHVDDFLTMHIERPPAGSRRPG